MKEEVKDSEDSVLMVSDITGKGTGYLVDGTYADYDPDDDSTAVASSVSDAVVIETGYVEVASVTAAAVATGAVVSFEIVVEETEITAVGGTIADKT